MGARPVARCVLALSKRWIDVHVDERFRIDIFAYPFRCVFNRPKRYVAKGKAAKANPFKQDSGVAANSSKLNLYSVSEDGHLACWNLEV